MTITATATDTGVKIQWTAPAEHPNHWIALVPAGSPLYTYSTTLWQYLPAGESGEITLPRPAPGEYEVRYFTANQTQPETLAATAAVTVGEAVVIEQPEEVTSERAVRKITFYVDGVKQFDAETFDETEAARHLSNFALGSQSGKARIESRKGVTVYPVEPDEVGTWQK